MTQFGDEQGSGSSRRDFLRMGLATAGGLMVAACGGTAAQSASATSAASCAPKSSTTVSATKIAKPDLPWTNHSVPPAYLNFPKPFRSVNKVPGEGGPLKTVTWFSDEQSPPPPDPPGNTYWAGLNQRLGVNFEPVWGPFDSFGEKFATLIAGGDLPDLVLYDTGYTGTETQAQAVLQGAFTDLTDYLSGKGLNEFPNLALIPTQIFNNARVNGKIYGVPRPRTVATAANVVRADWAQTVGMPLSQIKNAKDFSELMIAFHTKNPMHQSHSNTYGLTDIQYSWQFIAEMYGVANNWKLDKGGKLVKDLETEQYKEALSYARDLFKQGGFYPGAPSVTASQHYSLYEAGQTGAYEDALYAAGQTRPYLAQIGATGPFLDILVPPGANGGKGVAWNSAAYNGMVMIPAKVGKNPKAVKQLLSIVDYFCAPFGSEEWRFMNYGVVGTDSTQLPDGSLTQTAAGKAAIGDIFRCMTPPSTTYTAPQAPFTSAEQQAWTKLVNQTYYDNWAIGIDDPTQGLLSQTWLSDGPTLNDYVLQQQLAIVGGNQPLSALSETIQSWKSQGGDQARQEFETALQKCSSKA